MSLRNLLMMQALTVAALTCALSSCASQAFKEDTQVDSKGRQIASKPERLTGEIVEGSLQKYFDALWGTIHPEREVEQNLDQLVRLYYRAERQLADRELMHRALQRISFVYDRLLEIRSESDTDTSDYKRAELALQAFHQYFLRAKGSDRLALYEASVQFKEVFDRYFAQKKAPRVKNADHPFVNTVFEGNEKVEDFARKSEVQDELSRKVLLLETTAGDEFETAIQNPANSRSDR